MGQTSKKRSRGTLNKRYLRSLRANAAFYISTGILTVVTLLLFYLFYIGGTGILEFGEEFFASQALEDANFTTYLPISEEELEALEEEYDLVLEAQEVLNITEDGTTARIFLATEKIDLYAITAGKDLSSSESEDSSSDDEIILSEEENSSSDDEVILSEGENSTSDDEIILSEGYAVHEGIEIGDTISLAGKDYRVCGFFQRPDYLYMLENTDDSYKNISTFYLAYVSEENFESLGTPQVTYLVRYNKDNSREFREAVNDTWILQSYLASNDNMRIQMVDEQAKLFLVMAYIILVVMPLVAVVLICILISRKIKEEQRLIGTLASFGITRRKIIAHYTGFAALPGLAGGVLAFLFAFLFAQPYGELCLQDYEPMHAHFHLPIAIGLLGIVVPTLIYILAAAISASRLLRAKTVDLLSGRAGAKNHARTAFRRSRMPFGAKFALRSMLGNPARAFAVTLGCFLGSLIILICFALIDSINHVSENSIDAIGSFEYEYILNSLLTEEPEEGSPMLVSSFETESGRSVSFMGSEEENPYLELHLEDGSTVTDMDGWYLSSAASFAENISAGDTVTFLNPLTLEETEITITDVVEYDMGCVLFTSIGQMQELLGLSEGTYNAIMSDCALEIDSAILRQTIEKSALREQCDTILEQMGPIIYAFVFLGIIICIASIYSVVNMMVKENRGTISMLKVLGYRDPKINRIVLSANHLLPPVGILLSIPVTFVCLDMFWSMMLDYDVMRIRTYVGPHSYLYTVVLTLGCYFLSVALVSRQTRKVSMVEALKDQRE
ncbi:MAG: ABC transporter permease [Lachnospiraceae bacterium]|nr:ABC transporter permease [Lachnospiraceae bacterium]